MNIVLAKRFAGRMRLTNYIYKIDQKSLVVVEPVADFSNLDIILGPQVLQYLVNKWPIL